MENWEKFKIITNAVSILLIPVVLAIVGNMYTKATKEREVQGKFVELAVQILRDVPTDSNRNVREWATNVITQYSGVPMNQSTKEDLINSVPITTFHENYDRQDIAIGVKPADIPTSMETIIGNGQMGNILVFIIDPATNDTTLVQKGSPGKVSLPPILTNNNRAYKIRITGSIVDINTTTDKGNIDLVFYHKDRKIWTGRFPVTFKEENGLKVFNTLATIKLDNN